MHRIEQLNDEVIELGVASIATKGGGNQELDGFLQQNLQTGIADD